MSIYKSHYGVTRGLHALCACLGFLHIPTSTLPNMHNTLLLLWVCVCKVLSQQVKKSEWRSASLFRIWLWFNGDSMLVTMKINSKDVWSLSVLCRHTTGELAPHLGRPLLAVFLQGTKDPDQSVRTSSLSNLGELCQRLDYALGPLAQEVSVTHWHRPVHNGLTDCTFTQLLCNNGAQWYT